MAVRYPRTVWKNRLGKHIETIAKHKIDRNAMISTNSTTISDKYNMKHSPLHQEPH